MENLLHIGYFSDSYTFCYKTWLIVIKIVWSLTYDYFRSLLWVGPALLFSTATAISVLGWDGKVRTILSIRMPNAALYYTTAFLSHQDELLYSAVWCIE
ncbi:unnamed protein product [Camellia sinensis]